MIGDLVKQAQKLAYDARIDDDAFDRKGCTVSIPSLVVLSSLAAA